MKPSRYPRQPRSRWILTLFVLMSLFVPGSPGGVSPVEGKDVGSRMPGPNNPTAPITDTQVATSIRVSTPYKMAFGGSGVSDIVFSPDGRRALLTHSAGVVTLLDVASGKMEQQLPVYPTGWSAQSNGTFSPDGKLALIGLGLWDLDTGELLRFLPLDLPQSAANHVAFSPDGTQVLVERITIPELQIWGFASGGLIRSLDPIPIDTQIRIVSFSPDGTQVLAAGVSFDEAGSRNRAWLWNTADGRLVTTFEDVDERAEQFSSAAFSPDGKLLLSGGFSNANLWDTTTGQLLRTLEVDAWPSYVEVAFSPDGMTALTAAGTGSGLLPRIKLWRTDTWEVARTYLNEGDCCIIRMNYMPDATRILVGYFSGMVKSLDISNGQSTVVFGGSAPALSLAFSSDGTQVLTGGSDGIARLWDAGTGNLERTFGAWNWRGLDLVAFSSDSRMVLTRRPSTASGQQPDVTLWDSATGQPIRAFRGTAAALSPDGRMLLIGTQQGTAQLWDVITGQVIRTFEGHSAPVLAAAFSPDGKQVITGGADTTARLWDVATGQTRFVFLGHAGRVDVVAFSPVGRQALTGSEDGTVRLWDIANGGQLHILTLPDKSARSAAFSPDGTQVVTDGAGFAAVFWDTAQGELVSVFGSRPDDAGQAARSQSVAFSPDGADVLVCDRGDVFLVNSGRAARPLAAFRPHTEAILSLAFSPDGTKLVTGSADGTAKVWDGLAGRLQYALEGHTNRVHTVAFSADGRYIVTGSWDDTARLWDAADGRHLRTFEASSLSSSDLVAVSADGRRVLTGGDSVRLWDAANGQLLRAFGACSSMVKCSVALSPDGTKVLAEDSGNAWLWSASSGQLLLRFSLAWRNDAQPAFSPDGKHIMLTSVMYEPRLNGVHIFDATDGRLLEIILHERSSRWNTFFARAGTYLAVANGSTVRTWDLTQGQPIGSLGYYAAYESHLVESVALSPDGKTIAVGQPDGTVQFWSLEQLPWDFRQPTPLTLDSIVESQVERFAWRDFALRVPAGAALSVEVEPLDGAPLTLFSRFDQLPTLSQYDSQAAGLSANGKYSLQIAPTRGGTYYLSVFGRSAGSFRITARTTARLLSDVTPRSVGNHGDVTLSVTGIGFAEGMRVSLQRPGGSVYLAEEITLASTAHASARFALAGADLGIYDLVAGWPGGDERRLEAAVEVKQGAGPRLEASLEGPAAFRAGRAYSLQLHYANSGDADMPAPLFVISSPQNALMRLSPAAPYQSGPLQILGVNFSQPAGVLRPGERYQIPIYFVAPDVEDFQFNLDQMIADATPINWSKVEGQVRPPEVDPEVWRVFWPVLQAQIGSTWADYVLALGNDATYLGSLGRTAYTVEELFRYETRKALGINPRPVLAEQLDARCPAPGMDLRFERTLPSSLPGRFYLGTLGRGWSHSYDIYLQQLQDGDVSVHMPGAFTRLFSRNVAGVYTASPGDFGHLARSGDVFTLTEKDATVYRFRPDGKLDRIQDPNGNSIALVYDAAAHLVEIRHSNGDRFLLEYNAQGRIARLTDHAGRVTEFRYDASGEHLISVTAPGNRVTTYTYNSPTGSATDHALTSTTDPDGRQRHYAYDSRGRLAAEWLDAGAERITYAYTDQGRIEATDASGRVAAISPVENGLPGKLEDPLGRTIRLAYDANINLTRLTDPAGQPYAMAYDQSGNAVALEDPLGDRLLLAYDYRFSKLGVLEDARGIQSRYEYDESGNLATLTYPDGSREVITHDAAGNPTSFTRRSNAKITYSYNARGQLLREDYPDGSWATFAYDAAGNMISATDANGTITMAYDAADHLIKITYPSGHFFEYSYNGADQRTQRRDRDGQVLNYAYDNAGRLSRIYDGVGANIVLYQYDAVGRRSRKTLGNGAYATYEYDAAGQLVRLVNSAPDGTILSRFDYTYDAIGNPLTMTTLQGTYAYEYDALGQLTGATYPDGKRVAYAYDPAGNRTSVVENGVTISYTTNTLNQYLQVGDATYGYDADGNLTSRTAGGQTTAYRYNYDNRLVRAETPALTVGYQYDPLGKRIARTDATGTTRFVYDGMHVGLELDAAGIVTSRYTIGEQTDEVLQMQRGGNSYWYNLDALGSVRDLMAANGGVLERYDYDPYGLPRGSSALGNPWFFTGREYDSPTGLQYNRARYYSPILGRFTSVDPIGLAGGTNLYSYVDNSPLSFLDPRGLDMGDDVKNDPVIKKVEKNWPNVDPADLREAIRRLEQYQEKYRRQSELDERIKELYPDTLAPWSRFNSRRARAIDPNEKQGPAGTGDLRAVGISGELQYTVYFENISTATAPAQEVVIVDRLDSNLDWTSFRPVEIAFGDTVIPIADGSYQFYNRQAIIDYREGVDKQWWVDINAEINPLSGRAEWTFRILDPETGQLPEDALAGFLPPNDATGRGEGHVSFSIKPKTSARPGSRISNKAVISFDTESPIETNEWTNTIGAFNDLVLTKTSAASSVTVGSVLTYTLGVSNRGPDVATGVVVTDTLLASVSLVSISASQGTCTGTAVVVCEIGSLDEGDDASITIAVTPTVATTLSNTANVTGSASDTDPSNNTAAATTLVRAAADLVVTKSGEPDTVTAGQALTYTIAITNNGPSPTLGVVVTDTLPAGVTLGTISSSQGTCGREPVVACNLDALGSGMSAMVTLVVTPTVGAILTNTVHVTSDVFDPNTSNNGANAITRVMEALRRTYLPLLMKPR